MIDQAERDYALARAAEERRRAALATDPAVQKAHLQMALAYRKRASGEIAPLVDPTSPIGSETYRKGECAAEASGLRASG